MNQLEKSMEFNEEEVDEAEQQQQLYAQTIRASSAEPSRQIKRSSSVTSQTRRLANSENFHKRTTNTTSSNNFNFALHSTNDFKYIGEQFKVGKINPCLQSTSEKLFQKMYKDKLSKLYDSSKNLNKQLVNTLAEGLNQAVGQRLFDRSSDLKMDKKAAKKDI